jgi:hypothetical protein
MWSTAAQLTMTGMTETLEMRLATAHDAPALHRLAALDSAPPLEGEVLIALLDGEAVAALSLEDARVIATPFRLTEDVVALLRLRARRASPPRLRLRAA